MAGEPQTMRQVAENLVAFASSRGLDEDAGCRTWAEERDGRGARYQACGLRTGSSPAMREFPHPTPSVRSRLG